MCTLQNKKDYFKPDTEITIILYHVHGKGSSPNLASNIKQI